MLSLISKLFKLSFFLTLTFSALAKNTQPNNFFRSPYIGGSIGNMLSFADIQANTSAIVTGPSFDRMTLSNRVDENQSYKNSFAGSIVVGTGDILYKDNVFFGLEAFTNIANRKITTGSSLNRNAQHILFPDTLDTQLNNNPVSNQNYFDFGGITKLGYYLNNQLFEQPMDRLF